MEWGRGGQGQTSRGYRTGGKVLGLTPNPKLKLLDQVREVMRIKHYSPKHANKLLVVAVTSLELKDAVEKRISLPKTISQSEQSFCARDLLWCEEILILQRTSTSVLRRKTRP